MPDPQRTAPLRSSGEQSAAPGAAPGADSLRATLNSSAPPEKAPAKAGKSKRPKLIVAGACAALVCLGLAYLVGRYEVGVERDAIKLEAERQAAESERTLSGVKQQLTAEQARTKRLRAMLSLYEATHGLTSRNFGIAESKLKEAANRIEETAPADDSELGKLVVELRDTKVVVTDDVSEQRRKLDELGKRLVVALDADAK